MNILQTHYTWACPVVMGLQTQFSREEQPVPHEAQDAHDIET